ncbi:single-stranded-DNA-specific exonuclease RecJ [Evansella cellulosilytica]|uniref:Single-stranded-DNA-specific exonuclease RecJ n=1 Tax=Evansella cellulosilytica (strain ATCC 21833 / DSM 2522 / FERM P-1141 / JCM 9156 / N-4) TaxID=649639 RepID=E6TV85_EVAC2|nr:single-stranded-DNA-specific exonuclease RecJ [Evansella cellulosilytica]ADU29769.1 single-stranded-DNA-specific exonuclease RecJ [Evansella cellulosilytica DSM 2522]
MLQPKARWKITEANENQVMELANQLNISMIAARFLVQRGYDDVHKAQSFLHMDASMIHDPFLLKDMEKAVKRIHTAIKENENILVFGDYDADGVTSTSLMYLTLKQLGANVGFYVPNRFTEGYGPNEQAFRHAKEENVSLIITVDTGIAANHEAEVAKELGVDLIITDHHEPPPTIPDAYAVINPKQDDCFYPNKNLAGVGVAFKVAHALLNRVPTEYIDLVAIGSIADLVPLIDENRFLAAEGIHSLTREQRPGLKALMEHCNINPLELNEEHIGFMIGPRLNAAGRLDSADPAIQLLLSEDDIEAYELAIMIDDLNKERQTIVNEMAKEAEEQVLAKDTVPSVLIVGQAGWNAGVIGIVASRLVEKFYRPTIVLSLDESTGLAKGSARSIEGFDLFQALSQCREWLPHFGGHPMAAGLTMKIENINLLQEKMCNIAETTVAEENWIKSLAVDLPVKVSEVTTEAITHLQEMAPFGVGNPAPKALIENVELAMTKKIGAKEDHLKLSLKDEESVLDGIAFRMGNIADELSPIAKLSVVGQLSINEWNGHVKPQMIIEDIKVDEWQLFDLRSEKEPWTKINQQHSESIVVAAFRSESASLLSKIPAEWKTISFFEGEVDYSVFENKFVLLLDLPESFEQLESIFSVHDKPKRVYASFIHEKDHYFEMLPTREHFVWFYAFLKKRTTFDIEKHGADLAKHKGWSLNGLKFICSVFFDLGFVKISNGFISIVDSPGKKELEESPTYKKRIEQSEIENVLLYSSFNELKSWIQNVMEKEVVTMS